MPETPSPLLELRNVHTSYGLSRVLFGISLTIARGQMVSLLGRNGMGKTTTVRSIMGLTPPTAGSIRFDGDEILGQPAYRIAKHGIGLVPEGRQVFPNLTARENLIATAADYGVDTKPRLEVVKTTEPPVRKAGVKVKTVAELIDKLKNEAGAI